MTTPQKLYSGLSLAYGEPVGSPPQGRVWLYAKNGRVMARTPDGQNADLGQAGVGELGVESVPSDLVLPGVGHNWRVRVNATTGELMSEPTADPAQMPRGAKGEQGVPGPQGLRGLEGAPGLQGERGDKGLDGLDGRGFNPRGSWATSSSYAVDDVVVHDGQTYRARQTIDGTTAASTFSPEQVPTLWETWAARGPQGVQGVQGEQGQRGLQGDQGPQGLVGDQGVQGPQGERGLQGFKGDQGVQGVVGPEGPRGLTGDRGERGLQGLTGNTGPVGPQGDLGPVGPAGLEFQGAWSASATYLPDDAVAWSGSTYFALDPAPAAGVQPTSGDDDTTTNTGWALLASEGARGAEGPQGPQGLRGLTGPQGTQGVQGVAGPQGATGAQGLKGDTGLTGATGAQGIQGVQGVKGDTGLKGDTGAQGIQGPQGLKGDTGAAGAVGPVGAQGIQGVKGDTGATGAQGTQGVQGNVGPQGVQGTAGTRGSIWYTGIVAPTLAATPGALNNDQYLNTDTAEKYKFNGTSWVADGTLTVSIPASSGGASLTSSAATTLTNGVLTRVALTDVQRQDAGFTVDVTNEVITPTVAGWHVITLRGRSSVAVPTTYGGRGAAALTASIRTSAGVATSDPATWTLRASEGVGTGAQDFELTATCYLAAGENVVGLVQSSLASVSLVAGFSSLQVARLGGRVGDTGPEGASPTISYARSFLRA